MDILDRVQRRVAKVFKGLESLPCKETLLELGLFSLEKAQAGPHHSIPVFKGHLQRGQRLSLHKEQHREDKACIGSKFTLRNILSRDVVESPLLKIFKMCDWTRC